jgi:hypothetical protein
MISGYYKVVVKIEEENGMNKNGTPKIKKSQEIYIVKCGSPQDAADRVEKEMEGITFDWKIDTVKEVNITKIIEE